MAIQEVELMKRSIDGIEYRVDNVPVNDRELRVTIDVTCSAGGWTYEGRLSPKRVDLCIARYLLTQSSKVCTAGQLRWCASVGTALGLNAPTALGYVGSNDLDAALGGESATIVQERLVAIVHELVMGKGGDRMINQMVLRAEPAADGVITMPWIPPPKAGIFSGVTNALSGGADVIAARVRKYTPFNFGDK